MNNAGYFPNRSIDELDLPTWRRTMATTKSRLTLFEREIFLTTDETEKMGPLRRNIVEHGWLGYTGMSHYIASKMGIIGFMRSLANDVANDGIPQTLSHPV